MEEEVEEEEVEEEVDEEEEEVFRRLNHKSRTFGNFLVIFGKFLAGTLDNSS